MNVLTSKPKYLVGLPAVAFFIVSQGIGILMYLELCKSGPEPVVSKVSAAEPAQTPNGEKNSKEIWPPGEDPLWGGDHSSP